MSQTPTKYQQAVEAFNEDTWWQHPDYPVSDWRHEVADDNTRQSYRDWVLHKIDPDEGRPKARLHIVAGMISHIWRSKNGDEWTSSPCDGLSAEIKIKHDSVWINGKFCGNRHGGVKQFCNMLHRVDSQIVTDITGNDYEVPNVERIE